MLPPLPRCSAWAYSSLISPSRVSLPRKGHRVGLHIVLFEACSAFTRVAACTLARSPIRDPLSEGFRHFVTSMPAPVASGWSGCRVGLAPTGKRRLVTAHTHNGRSSKCLRIDALAVKRLEGGACSGHIFRTARSVEGEWGSSERFEGSNSHSIAVFSIVPFGNRNPLIRLGRGKCSKILRLQCRLICRSYIAPSPREFLKLGLRFVKFD